MPEEQAESFIAFHSGSEPGIASTGLGPCTVQPVVAEKNTIDFELGYGGCKAMQGSAMLVLRATLSESGDAFARCT
jgi:hypothetical protein